MNVFVKKNPTLNSIILTAGVAIQNPCIPPSFKTPAYLHEHLLKYVTYRLDYALATDMYFAKKFCNWENIEYPLTRVI
jgi:hypothetical protein